VLSDVLSRTAARAAAAAPARGKHGKPAAKPPAAGAADTAVRRSEAACSSRGTCVTCMTSSQLQSPALCHWSELRPPRVLSGADPLVCGRLGERLSVPHAAFRHHATAAGSSAAICVARQKTRRLFTRGPCYALVNCPGETAIAPSFHRCYALVCGPAQRHRVSQPQRALYTTRACIVQPPPPLLAKPSPGRSSYAQAWRVPPPQRRRRRRLTTTQAATQR
jgi:hypothetical protein